MASSSARQSAKKKSFLSLLTDVPHLIVQLVRAEIELLKAELAAKLKAAGIGIGLFAISVSLVIFALLLLVFAAVFALALVVPLWAAALISAAAVLILAVVVAGVGAAVISRAKSPKPNETIESIREDISVLRGQQ
jgi:uncharacterized membrane protein YqjE